MNALLNGMKQSANVCRTENGGASYKSTMNGLMDLFALGGAYRSRTEEDVILLFDTAFKEDEVYALKCLFYLRDVRGGQGERRFFRTVCKWLAKNHTEAMRRNLIYVPEFGRWDDLYIFVGTPLEVEALDTYEKNNISDGGLGYVPKKGERFKVSEDRLETLLGKNVYNKPFVKLVEEKAVLPKKKVEKKYQVKVEGLVLKSKKKEDIIYNLKIKLLEDTDKDSKVVVSIDGK